MNHYVKRTATSNDDLVLFASNANLSLSLLDSPWWRIFMESCAPEFRRVSSTTFCNKLLPHTAKKVMDFVVNQLMGCKVTLVVDEMRKNHCSFYNFVLAADSDIDMRGVNVFFWDSISMETGTSSDVGKAIADQVNALTKLGLDVVAYATDNCSVMRGTEDFVKAHCGRSIPRIPCVSHYLNGILKKMLKQEPLKTLWNNVRDGYLSHY